MQERGPVQLSPPGLLGLLQLKAEGRSVPNLGDTCVPSLEMAGWWLRAAATLYTGSSSDTLVPAAYRVFSGFTSGPLTVPSGEWWYVHDLNYEWQTAPTGTATGMRMAWSAVPTGSTYYKAFPADGPLLTMGGNECRVSTAQDFWLPPGARIGYWVDVVAVANFSVAVRQLRYTPCKV
jgi:hypothetical protein